MLESHDRCRLDPRTDPLELAIGCGFAGGLGRGVGRLVGPAIDSRDTCALRRAVTRALGLAGRLGLGGDPPARHLGIARTILTAGGLAPSEGNAMEDELVGSGRFVRIEARGSKSGLARPVTVGFVDDEMQPGSLLVAANSPETAWGRNLLDQPACHVRVGERSFDAMAEPLEPADHALAIRGLILRYGTPAEGLGRGPSFRLRPVGEGTA